MKPFIPRAPRTVHDLSLVLPLIAAVLLGPVGCCLYFPDFRSAQARSHSEPAHPPHWTYSEAIGYARSHVSAYDDLQRFQTGLLNGIALTVIALAGAAIGLAASGATGDPVIALATASATGVTGGAWIQRGSLPELLRIGRDSDQCVINVAPPLTESISLFSETRSKLRDQVGRIDSLIAQLDSLSRPDESITPTFRTYSTTISVQLTRARDLSAFGRRAIDATAPAASQLDLVANQIANAVDTIDGTIVGTIRSGQPSLLDLKAGLTQGIAISPLKGIPTTISGTPPPVPSAGAVPYSTDGLTRSEQAIVDTTQRAMTQLEKAAVQVRDLTSTLAVAAGDLSIGETAGDITQCISRALRLTTEATEQTPVQVQPVTLELTKGGPKQAVMITGGTPPYAADRLGAAADKLTTEGDNTDGVQLFSIGVDPKTPGTDTGPYSISIHDSKGQGSTVTVKLKPQSP